MKVSKEKDKQSHKAQLKEIELEKEKVELARAKASYEHDKIRLRDAKKAAQWKDTDDHYFGVFDLIGNVGNSTVDLEERIRRWARIHPGKPITLRIFSPGGSVFHGLELFNTLRRLAGQGHHVTTDVQSMAASMGSFLYLAGDTRVIGKDAQVMFHPISAGVGGSLVEMEDTVDWYRRLNEQLDKTIVGRTKLTKKILKEKASRSSGWWLSAEECVKYGVAHEIV